MLKLDSREVKLGVNLATPTQKHGEERVPMKVLRLKNILLTREEVEVFFDDKLAWEMLYLERKGKPAQPYWGEKLGALPVPGKWRESAARITFGLKPHSCEFTDAQFSRVQMEPQVGGLTAMSLTLGCLKSHIKGDLAGLDDYLGAMVNVSLEFGAPGEEDDADEEDVDAQPELDIKHVTKSDGPRPAAH